jgi:hypothetical protein
MTTLPNPFLISALAPVMAVETAAAPDLTDPPVAAADRFVLDERSFMEALEEVPSFLSAPRPEFLAATDLMPVLAVLAGH